MRILIILQTVVSEMTHRKGEENKSRSTDIHPFTLDVYVYFSSPDYLFFLVRTALSLKIASKKIEREQMDRTSLIK